MSTAKVAISVDEELLAAVDMWVEQGLYPNRSQAVQAALREKNARLKRNRLHEALKLVDPVEERALAEEWLEGEEWPEY
jgi:Arc/MetJ-type ribon-helix-helix transcriptional regulator